MRRWKATTLAPRARDRSNTLGIGGEASEERAHVIGTAADEAAGTFGYRGDGPPPLYQILLRSGVR
jgi:hypothetical protein